MRRKRMELFKKIITTVLAALLLTSCSSMNSGITVGDKEFSINDIQKPVDEILEARKSIDTSQMQLGSGADLIRNQAQFAVISVLLDQIASDMKILSVFFQTLQTQVLQLNSIKIYKR